MEKISSDGNTEGLGEIFVRASFAKNAAKIVSLDGAGGKVAR